MFRVGFAFFGGRGGGGICSTLGHFLCQQVSGGFISHESSGYYLHIAKSLWARHLAQQSWCTHPAHQVGDRQISYNEGKGTRGFTRYNFTSVQTLGSLVNQDKQYSTYPSVEHLCVSYAHYISQHATSRECIKKFRGKRLCFQAVLSTLKDSRFIALSRFTSNMVNNAITYRSPVGLGAPVLKTSDVNAPQDASTENNAFRIK